MKALTRMRWAFLYAVLAVCAIAAPLCMAVAGDGHDHDYEIGGEPETIFQYSADSSNKFNPSYDVIWDAMNPMYKGTIRDKNGSNPISPIIVNAEFDLNGDDIPEAIAYHMEAEDEKFTFCKKDGTCPYFVIDTSSKNPVVLGKIYAVAIDRGDSVENGYWTLKVYTKSFPGDFETYKFNKNKKKYEPKLAK
jgi:hypothetical protein